MIIKVKPTCPRAVRSVNSRSLFGSVQTQDAVYSEEGMSALMRAHARHGSRNKVEGGENKTSKSSEEMLLE